MYTLCDPLADSNVAISKVKWVMKGGAAVADKTKETKEQVR